LKIKIKRENKTENKVEKKKTDSIPLSLLYFESINLSKWVLILQKIGANIAIKNQFIV
jgi:hypothetical protein